MESDDVLQVWHAQMYLGLLYKPRRLATVEGGSFPSI
jgi:hypothetical protein